jgi:hypothetical protein
MRGFEALSRTHPFEAKRTGAVCQRDHSITGQSVWRHFLHGLDQHLVLRDERVSAHDRMRRRTCGRKSQCLSAFLVKSNTLLQSLFQLLKRAAANCAAHTQCRQRVAACQHDGPRSPK